MAGPLAGPLISAGASLLGGLFSKGASAGKNFRSHINGLMAAANQHGINPLALLNVSPVGPSQGNVFMGQAIADAGAIMGDALLKRQDAQKLQRAQQQNAYLQKKVTDLTLRPKVPGVYQQFPVGSNGASRGGSVQGLPPVRSGGAGGDSASGGSGAVEPLLDVHPWDIRREVDNDPVKTHPGFITIDNPTTGRMNIPTLDGDEALSFGEYPTALYAWATRERGLGYKSAKWFRETAWRDMIPEMPRVGAKAPPQNVLLDGVKRYGKSVKKKKPKHPLNALGF